ncbi:nucleotidyltransferase family protein [Dyadobacter sandarakinus]|uniref:Nucleotidyltransferase family protein n=1 Tax=Dyadobacter sandarakinus TaxID=2747268 RepID=A0ABX7I6W4_9BACT|nr:nucleotidyltransferase family protein [Dyadobacter sandarakinus]QRR01583.1 nucleotidyltransferase family protein [Dyadobacter sandarakinus]
MTGIIILAAGNSSRLGKPKQLLHFRGQSLLSHMVQEALNVQEKVVFVVTGAKQELIDAEIGQKPVHLIYNPDWETGMGSSIAAGVKALCSMYPQLQAVIIAVCDQPFVNAEHLKQLIATAEHSPENIIASAYAGTMGTPALFPNLFFDELKALTGQEGAKKLFTRHASQLSSVHFPSGETDIDTHEDYEKLLKSTGL